MSAKFLQAFGDERSPELQRQMGCMTGIFQALDRHYLLAGRRLAPHPHKTLPPPPPSGHALSNRPSLGEESAACSPSPQIVLEKNFSKSWNENLRVSMESSRTSFSSSSCSSFSSLDCNRSTQQELPSTDRMIFPDRPFKNSPKLKSSSDSDSGYDHPDSLSNAPRMPPAQTGHPTPGIRSLVKDSIYRDSRSLPVKTSCKEAAKDLQFNYDDPPRPMLLPRSVDEPHMTGAQGKSKVAMDINESLRFLAKLREASWNSSEAGQCPRLSYDARDPFSRPLVKGAPRFSCDGREATPKLREVPRLSLDIKEGPLWTSDMESRPKSSVKDADKSSIDAASDIQQEQSTCKRPPSVVAKLMGLEDLPHLSVPSDHLQKESNSSKTASMPSKMFQERKPEPMLSALKMSHSEPVIRRRRNPEPAMRSVSNTRFPVETAPWKQQERIVLPQKKTKGFKEANARKQPASVYSEMEKRLKDLEFQESNKDLRALKQILDSMQAKGLLQSKRREESYTLKSDNGYFDGKDATDASLRLIRNSSSKQMKEVVTSSAEQNDAESGFKSPIVIMKPAKSWNSLSDADLSVIPLGGLSDLSELQTGNATEKKKASTNNRLVNDQTPKSSPRVPSQSVASSDRRSSRRTEESSKQKSSLPLTAEGSSGAQQLPRDTGSSLKQANSTSPRLQHKRLETDRRARPPLPSPESNKSRRQSANKNTLDSVSPRSKLRRKSVQAQQSDDQHTGVSGKTRSTDQQDDEVSARSDSNATLASELGIEVTSADKSAHMNISGFQQGSRSPSGRNPQKVKTSCDANEDISAVDPAPTTPEQPSPISVLDTSFDQDDLRPNGKTTYAARGDDNTHLSEASRKPAGASDTKPTSPGTQLKNKRLANVENLLQKLQQLGTGKDGEAPPVDHIAFLCETQSPDHRYVSEILLASGLLMKDLSSGQTGRMQIQPHSSGYPINPDLFLILEQRKSGWIANNPENIHPSKSTTKLDPKKMHRRLMFDMVNELLIQKFELESAAYLPSLSFRAKIFHEKVLSGQHLVKELCSEIEELKTERSSCDEDTSVIPDAEVLRKLEGWTNFGREVPGMVLEIERSIFKELVDEVVNGEAATGRQAKAGIRRRLPFAQ